MSDDREQYWLVYVRWPSGKRETIRTVRMDMISGIDAAVLAIVVEPRRTVLPGVALWSARLRQQFTLLANG